jgi:ADP-glucose pyrophosphorylase
MKDYISSGGANTFSLTFNDLTFDKNLKWVVWSGNFVKKIDWKVVFQKNGDSGAFFTINNEKLEIDETKTLNLINVYLSETFLKKISEAIDDKTLESQQINQA